MLILQPSHSTLTLGRNRLLTPFQTRPKTKLLENLIEKRGGRLQIPDMQSVFTGPVYVVRDNIDTDQIISAQFLNLVPTIPADTRSWAVTP